MKLLQPTLTLSLVTLLASPALAQPAWRSSVPLAPAVKAARGRLLLKVTVSWCAATTLACRELRSLLQESEVKRRLAAFDLLAYDAEQGEGKSVARRYNVVVFPTLLVIDRRGREVDRLTGHLPRRQLASWLQQATSGKGSLARLTARASARRKDMALQLKVGTAWALRGRKAEAVKHLDRVIRAAGTSAVPSRSVSAAQVLAARAMLVRGQLLELRSLRDHRAAMTTLRALRVRFPTSPEADRAVYPLARALHGLGRTKAALRLLSWWARTVEQHRKVAWFCCRNRVDAKRGVRHAQKTVKAQPNVALLWATLACVQDLARDAAGAGRSWGRALRLDPHVRWYRQQHRLHFPNKK